MPTGYSYTRAEKSKRARLLVKGAHNAYGDTAKVEAELDRIDRDAADRYQREMQAYERQLSTAKDEAAAAKVAERAAPRDERDTARERRKAAEKRLREAERARP
ncbi:hypothetical protein [Streptomyces sp. ODS28]|uniref:hypothetical protein n=1 Tax=Streptomyces sp. ODS28 TaxID=3136688 RepID=UPI0031ED97A2